MIVTNVFKKLGEPKGWTYTKFITFGKEQGYHITVTTLGMSRAIMIKFSPIYKQATLEISNYIEAHKKEMKVSQITYGLDFMEIIPKEVFKVLDSKKLQDILNVCISALQKAKVEPDHVCAICKKDHTNYDAIIDSGLYVPVHKTCFDQMNEAYLRKNSQK